MTDPVPRHRRNPRRAYDREGREIAPATVRTSAEIDAHSIRVYCNACHHTIVLGLDGLPDDTPIPDIPLVLRLRCGKCRSSNVGVMTDMTEHYANVRRVMAQEPEPLPEGYRVVPWQELVGPERAAAIARAPQGDPGPPRCAFPDSF